MHLHQNHERKNAYNQFAFISFLVVISRYEIVVCVVIMISYEFRIENL